ncbi:AGC family protein kinase [Trichomonas vaginalis G3]|uniref:AGC family protein kinase n=1 Tax=Trichomonas vaginalis (strain ATCC PRA-98 / G3) TaxID=412133 RepID=A2GIZ7_TRIV3|nr:protein serine/threonine kinase protein [Trichomonas vaginalis G3]EAX82869.1 AGC family protein kinase [Trichomonas vaginalis G3]KAI5509685.1 protein serine/threonine kinase protein [Trichomonas vaginalis G3]|eukprot:XP_001295799.1 AGC family protein kinase [Trichomonas vaginalis G3]
MEYLSGGDIQTVLEKDHHLLPAEQIRISSEILSALSYLHRRGISHRDIKPANIMFDKDLHPKLIDFGLCRELSGHLSTICDTYTLMAPEIIKTSDYDGTKADIWSFGVSLHILATGTYPFQYHSDSQYIKAVKTNQLCINIKAQGLIGIVIRECLKLDPCTRKNADELLDLIKAQNNHVQASSLLNIANGKRRNTFHNISISKNLSIGSLPFRSRLGSNRSFF